MTHRSSLWPKHMANTMLYSCCCARAYKIPWYIRPLHGAWSRCRLLGSCLVVGQLLWQRRLELADLFVQPRTLIALLFQLPFQHRTSPVQSERSSDGKGYGCCRNQPCQLTTQTSKDKSFIEDSKARSATVLSFAAPSFFEISSADLDSASDLTMQEYWCRHGGHNYIGHARVLVQARRP